MGWRHGNHPGPSGGSGRESMKRKNEYATYQQHIEILSPAGTIESVRAAVSAGCHAVYLGGKDFSARSAACNFERQELKEVLAYCHARGVKVYITVNTLYKDGELKDLFRFMRELYMDGADAFIMQDLGAAMAARDYFPDIPLHASTQMTAHSVSDVLFLQEAGFARVVLSRELGLQEIREIKAKTSVALESFVHGALCYCFSGQCLMSSFLGGRSGNRGRCAQPCRLSYRLVEKDGDDSFTALCSGYLLSPKDMMTLDILPDIVAAGVTSLKIEGRMKSPEYVGLVTEAYRKQIDAIMAGSASTPSQETRKKLTQIFNRGGFTTGYYQAYSGPDMMSIDSPKHAGLYIGRVEAYFPDRGQCVFVTEEPLTPGDGIEIWTKTQPHPGVGISKLAAKGQRVVLSIQGHITPGDPVYRSFDKALADEAKVYYQAPGHEDARQIIVEAFVRVVSGQPLLLRLSCHGIIAEAQGGQVQAALKQPMSPDVIIAQLSKTGGTPFAFRFDTWDIGLDIFVPVSALNALRRQAVSLLQDALVKAAERPLPMFNFAPAPKEMSGAQFLTVRVRTPEQMDAVLDAGFPLGRIYLDCNDSLLHGLEKYIAAAKASGIPLFAALPSIDRDGENLGLIESLEKTGIAGYLAGTLGQLRYAAETRTDKILLADDTLNTTNQLTYHALMQYAQGVAISPELTLAEIDALGGAHMEIMIYGRIRLMTTAQCPVGLYKAEKNSARFCRMKNHKGVFGLRDRKNVILPVVTNCRQCLADIYSDRPVSLFRKMEDIKRCAASALRLSFATESGPETAAVLRAAYAALFGGDGEIGRQEQDITGDAFTYGHFYKGIL